MLVLAALVAEAAMDEDEVVVVDVDVDVAGVALLVHLAQPGACACA